MNPPIKQDVGVACNELRTRYEMWKDGPDLKELEMISQTKFASWELPILRSKDYLEKRIPWIAKLIWMQSILDLVNP